MPKNRVACARCGGPFEPDCAEDRLCAECDTVEFAQRISEPFCACGHIISRCEGSRAGCIRGLAAPWQKRSS